MDFKKILFLFLFLFLTSCNLDIENENINEKITGEGLQSSFEFKRINKEFNIEEIEFSVNISLYNNNIKNSKINSIHFESPSNEIKNLLKKINERITNNFKINFPDNTLKKNNKYEFSNNIKLKAKENSLLFKGIEQEIIFVIEHSSKYENSFLINGNIIKNNYKNKVLKNSKIIKKKKFGQIKISDTNLIVSDGEQKFGFTLKNTDKFSSVNLKISDIKVLYGQEPINCLYKGNEVGNILKFNIVNTKGYTAICDLNSFLNNENEGINNGININVNMDYDYRLIKTQKFKIEDNDNKN